MQRDRLPYILIPVVALVAVLPLIVHGCSCGHDFDFHILSWMEAARQFSHGNLHPHWAYTPAYNAGEPRFVFYPPLSWSIGAILGFVMPWTWTPIVYTWLALTASGLALHRLARDFTTLTAALLAATFYTVNPYMLFTAYERTAYAELLAAAWIPMLLHAILRDKVTIPRVAIPVALLWLTNAPAAVMSCYALAFLALFRITHHELELRTQRTRGEARGAGDSILPDALRTVAGTALGLGLAAFYILPAAYERRYVQVAMAIIPNMRIQDNFLFHHTGDVPHDVVLHTASDLALLLLTLTVVAFTATALAVVRIIRMSRTGPSHGYRLVAPLATLAAAIALLLTPSTAFIWNHAPEMAFLQFPWRFLAILAAVLSLAAALALIPLRLKPALGIICSLVIAVALTWPAYTAFRQACDEEDTVQARVALFHSSQGTDPTDEYTPATADNDSLAHADPGFWLSPNPNAKAPANSMTGPAPAHLSLNLTTPQTLILNLREYPAWRIMLNQRVVTTREQRDDGLIAIPVPAGLSTLSIGYAQPGDQTIGDILTLASLAVLISLMLRTRKIQPAS